MFLILSHAGMKGIFPSLAHAKICKVEWLRFCLALRRAGRGSSFSSLGMYLKYARAGSFPFPYDSLWPLRAAALMAPYPQTIHADHTMHRRSDESVGQSSRFDFSFRSASARHASPPASHSSPSPSSPTSFFSVGKTTFCTLILCSASERFSAGKDQGASSSLSFISSIDLSLIRSHRDGNHRNFL